MQLASEILAVIGGLNMVIRPAIRQAVFQFEASYLISMCGYMCIAGLFLNAATSIVSCCYIISISLIWFQRLAKEEPSTSPFSLAHLHLSQLRSKTRFHR